MAIINYAIFTVIGFIFGLAVKMAIDSDIIRDQHEQILDLKEALRKASNGGKVEVIEIIDDTVGNNVDFSQEW